MSKVIRLDRKSHTLLEELSKEMGTSKLALIRRAIDLLMKDYFFHKTHMIYTRLQTDAESWKQELVEQQAWDGSLKNVVVCEKED